MTHPTRLVRSRAVAAAVLAVTGLVVFTPPSSAVNTSYYVDCSAGSNGSGTQASPFNNLTAASALTLGAGDQVLFKRGATCLGQYQVSGSGSTSSRIVVGAYGSGALPKIDANGAENAVRLNAVSNVTVQDLDLTAPGDGTTTRRGIYLYAADAGTVSNVTVQRLYIHDVKGKMPSTDPNHVHTTGKYANATGGIVVEAGGGTTATRYTNIDILDNELRTVDRQGIYFWSNWCNDPTRPQGFASGACTKSWFPHDDVVVRGNRLYDIGGDGVVPKTATNILVERNKVIGFNRRSNSPNIAFWVANTVGATFQYNEAAGGKGTYDSQGFDVDHSTDNTVFQYNYSHDNEGGFFLICPVTGNRNFTIRYNLSVDDKTRLFQICSGAVTNGEIYNNTIVVGNGLSPLVVTESNTANNLDIGFRNNIVSKEDSGTLPWSLSDPNFVIDHNAFRNVATHANATNTVTAAHGLISALHHEPRAYNLSTTSALHGAGVTISGNGGKDYFGNTVPSSGAPDIGAYEGSGTCGPALNARFDADTLGSAPSGWTTTGTVAVVNRPVASYASGEQGRSVELTRGAAETAMTSSFTATGDVRASLRVRAEQNNAPLGAFLLDANDVQAARFSLAASGKFAYTNNGSWVETGTYWPGEWYRVELVVKPGTGTYDVLVDGTALVTGAQLDSAAGAVAKVKVRSQSGGTSAQKFGVDDVLVRNC